MTDTQTPIAANKVAETRRLMFLPKHVGVRYTMIADGLIYQWAKRVIVGYDGGYWDFFDLSNGSFFVALQTQDPLQIEISGNGFGAELTAEAAGIVVTLFVLGHMIEKAYRAGDNASHERFDSLRRGLLQFADEHAEVGKIFAAID